MLNIPHEQKKPFPKGPLIGMWGLVIISLVGVTAVRLTGTESSRPTSQPVMVEDLRFEDMNNGGVAVYNVKSEKPIQVVQPGTNGFLRGALRGLARERKREGIGPSEPFRLTGWADGRLTLDDLSTGRQVDLGSFGPTNAQVFANLLPAKGAM